MTWSLGEFKTKVGAKNLFASDLEYTIIPKYGAANPNRGTLRYYYLVDKTGKIVWKRHVKPGSRTPRSWLQTSARR